MKKLLIILSAIILLPACAGVSEITEEELNQGWYYGQIDEVKKGTPDDWEFLEDGENSKWIKPPVENMMDY